MTSPALHRAREGGSANSAGDQNRLMSFVAVRTLTIGAVLSVAALFFQKNDLAIGLSLGALLSMLNFRGLKALTDDLVLRGEKGRNIFWFWNSLRWVLFALICGFFAKISPVSLMGAVVSYLLSLAVLGWGDALDLTL